MSWNRLKTAQSNPTERWSFQCKSYEAAQLQLWKSSAALLQTWPFDKLNLPRFLCGRNVLADRIAAHEQRSERLWRVRSFVADVWSVSAIGWRSLEKKSEKAKSRKEHCPCESVLKHRLQTSSTSFQSPELSLLAKHGSDLQHLFNKKLTRSYVQTLSFACRFLKSFLRKKKGKPAGILFFQNKSL